MLYGTVVWPPHGHHHPNPLHLSNLVNYDNKGIYQITG